LGQRACQTHESEQAPGPFPRESHACRRPLGAMLQVDSKESGVGRRDERSRFAVDVVLLSPLFTSTFGLVLGGFLPCQHITDGSIPLDGSPFPVKQCRESRWSPSSPTAYLHTPHCQQHGFSSSRTYSKDANTEPLSRANALANPTFQEAKHPKCP
jgi:hypothetical protein